MSVQDKTWPKILSDKVCPIVRLNSVFMFLIYLFNKIYSHLCMKCNIHQINSNHSIMTG